MTTAPQTNGRVLHWASGYDLLIWLLTLGKERRFREKLIAPVNLKPGESVLDVGCGTGSLAITAARRVGPAGLVVGVDPSEKMIARARKKAGKARVRARFEEGLAQALPFQSEQFDVVLSSVMLHHLPRKDRPAALREMRRVLKPGGRLFIADFGARARGLVGHLHRRHQVNPKYLVDLVSEAGFNVVDSGVLDTWSLQYVLANLLVKTRPMTNAEHESPVT